MLPRAASYPGSRLGGIAIILKGCGASHATLLMMRNQGAETAAAVMPVPGMCSLRTVLGLAHLRSSNFLQGCKVKGWACRAELAANKRVLFGATSKRLHLGRGHDTTGESRVTPALQPPNISPVVAAASTAPEDLKTLVPMLAEERRKNENLLQQKASLEREFARVSDATSTHAKPRILTRGALYQATKGLSTPEGLQTK